MKRLRLLAPAAILFFLTCPVAAAFPADDPPGAADPEVLRAEAEKLLREAASAAPALASPVNRVIVCIRIAESIWEIDQSVTWSMLGAAGEDVKRLLAQIDIEANRRDSAGAVRGRRGNSGFRGRSNIAFELRKEYVRALAGYAPDQARAFVFETAEMMTNEDLRSRASKDNRALEADIEKKIALNDVGKALEIAREKLGAGVSSEVINLAGSIYRRDPGKGAGLAGEILEKLRTASVDPARAWTVTRFLQTAMKYAENSVPLLDRDGMKALAAVLTAYVVDPRSRYTTLPSPVLEVIESHSKGNADSIRAAFEERLNRRSLDNTAGLEASAENQDWRTRRLNARNVREGINDLFEAVEDSEASEDERREAIAGARETILAFQDEQFRLENLAALAVRAHRSGEPEEAASLMKEAEMFLAASPRDRSDFSASMTIANAYSTVDPAKAFAMFEDMIYRLNGVIDGYVRFAEFSSNGRSVESGELIMNRFSRQFLGYFNLPDGVVSDLAAYDAERLANLADQFDRQEVRMEMRMMIVQAMLKAIE